MLFPRQIARFWVLWTHAFSATVSIVYDLSVSSGIGTWRKIMNAIPIPSLPLFFAIYQAAFYSNPYHLDPPTCCRLNVLLRNA